MTQWYPKRVKPRKTNWYITGSHNTGYPYTVPRYYAADDDTWWIYSDHHDNRTLVPNNSFFVWCEMPKYGTGLGDV